MTPIATKTLTTELIQEGSWGHRELGTHESTMNLYLNTDDTGMIEWDVPGLDITEHIGLWFEIDPKGVRTLCDYDGIMGYLPDEAIALMEENGIVVPADQRAPEDE